MGRVKIEALPVIPRDEVLLSARAAGIQLREGMERLGFRPHALSTSTSGLEAVSLSSYVQTSSERNNLRPSMPRRDMTEPNGIDILCDAAGSDLLLSNFYSLGAPIATPPAVPSGHQHVKRVKLSNNDVSSSPPPPAASASSSSNHVCYICKRVYERADHLTRHMRSHENARPYACSRCPKRFNRADLLTRHETTHDRDGDGKTRVLIRRSDRAAEACFGCAASKAKCDDQKPCDRCVNKGIPCQMPPRKASTYKTIVDDNSALSPSDASSMTSNTPGDMYGMANSYAPDRRRNVTSNYNSNTGGAVGEAVYMAHAFQPNTLLDGVSDDNGYFNPAHNLFFQDIDFTSFDLPFDTFVIPPIDPQGPSPQSSSTATSKPGRIVARDASRGYAAFKQSPWLWEPELKDYVSREKQGLHLNEEAINNSAAFEKLVDKPSQRPKLGLATRDRLFAMILGEHKEGTRVPSFPSLDLLNYLVQAHFAHEEHQCDSFMHASTFNPDDTLTELLGSVIGSGATFISVPAIWQFGYAIQEIVRVRMERLFESKNSNTRNLRCLQAYMLELDVGIWSGFKRKTELAEGFLQPLLTMMRRAGALNTAAESVSLIPSSTDSTDVLETKWHKFIQRESYKRLVLHLFFHDVQTSISLQKNPLMSFSELAISLPASRDIWKAPSAKAWREAYLRKIPLPPETQIPRVPEIMHRLRAIDDIGEYVDMELCYTAVLHGFWGQISSYREAIKFFDHGIGPDGLFGRRLWLKTQHQELYRDLSEFSTTIYSSRKPVAHLTIIAELFMMILHVSLDDLQRFAGKLGEEEARRASTSLEQSWANTPEARCAVWHAGQVLSSARRLAPTSLRRFSAVAVYFAGLTLWTYGLLCSSDPEQEEAARPIVFVDGEETRDTRAFVQHGRGVPGLVVSDGVELLSNPGAVLAIARGVFRDNFPVRNEPLPPLVESLENLLRGLGSGPVGKLSREGSEDGDGRQDVEKATDDDS